MMASRGMTGVVSKVSDTSVEITLRNQPSTIVINAQTLIYTSAAGSRADLKPGDTIVVTGERAADGTLSATSILIMPPSKS